MIIGELVLKRKTRTPIRKKIEEEIRPTNPYTFKSQFIPSSLLSESSIFDAEGRNWLWRCFVFDEEGLVGIHSTEKTRQFHHYISFIVAHADKFFHYRFMRPSDTTPRAYFHNIIKDEISSWVCLADRSCVLRSKKEEQRLSA